MTSLHTPPLPLPRSLEAAHEHAWITESRHRTSEGTVLYVRCTDCPARRVDLKRTDTASASGVPAPLSRTVGDPAAPRP